MIQITLHGMENIRNTFSDRIINRYIRKMENITKCYISCNREYNTLFIKPICPTQKSKNRFNNNIGNKILHKMARSLTATGQGAVYTDIVRGIHNGHIH